MTDKELKQIEFEPLDAAGDLINSGYGRGTKELAIITSLYIYICEDQRATLKMNADIIASNAKLREENIKLRLMQRNSHN